MSSERTLSDAGKDFVYLSRSLDALDRLYDGESNAVDVEAILRVSGMALGDRPLGAKITGAADQLVEAIRTVSPKELSAEDALAITDLIRVPISHAWSDLDR